MFLAVPVSETLESGFKWLATPHIYECKGLTAEARANDPCDHSDTVSNSVWKSRVTFGHLYIEDEPTVAGHCKCFAAVALCPSD